MHGRTRRNLLANAAGEALWGFQSQMIAPATVLTLLLARYGASQEMIGGIGATEGGAVVLTQILGAMAFRSIRHRKRQLIVYHLVAMIPFLFVMAGVAALANRLPAAAVRWGLLAGFVCFQCSMGAITSVWFDWVAHLFDRRVRGTVMGLSFCVAWTAGIGGARLAGRILHSVDAPGADASGAFALLYLLAGCVATASILTFGLIDDPATREPDRTQALDLAGMMGKFRASLRDRNFRTYLIGRSCATMGLMMPFVALYYTSRAGGGMASDRLVALAGTAQAIGAATGQVVIGRLGDKLGHRLGILVTTGAGALALAVVLATRGWGSAVAAYALAGLCGGGGFVAHTNLLIETCPHDHRLAHMTLGSLLLAPGLVLAPILAGVVAQCWGLPVVFALNLAFSLAALTWFLLRLKEPRELEAKEVEVEAEAVAERQG